ncbi:hypothetical protein VPH35_013971 [Triticum aestivum]
MFKFRWTGLTRASSRPRASDKPIIVDMEAALRAVAGKLAVCRVLSPYLVNHKAVINDLRGPWRLHSDAVGQRVTSKDGRFIITFSEDGDRQHVLRVETWHFRNNAVLLAEFDGKRQPRRCAPGLLQGLGCKSATCRCRSRPRRWAGSLGTSSVWFWRCRIGTSR